MASKFRPSDGFMRDRYSTAFCPIEVDELLEGEWRSHHVGGHVLEGFLSSAGMASPT
jgi:hypothetical protein